jgi:nitrate/nitrite-specific signal transduction histidine kinase
MTPFDELPAALARRDPRLILVKSPAASGGSLNQRRRPAMSAIRTFFAVLALAIAPAWAHHAAYLDDAAAINKAGRQRMLSQLMVKEYMEIAARLGPGTATGHLFDAITVFDDQIADLRSFSTTPDLRDTFLEVEKRWLEFRALVTASATRANAAALHAAGERLLEAAERNTAALERHAGTPAARLVNVAGRQRMLSQRIAKDYLLVNAGVNPEVARAEMKSARSEFLSGMEALRKDPPGGEGDKLLEEVGALWKELDPLVAREHSLAQERERVIRLADAILLRMERVTGLYEKRTVAP